LLAFVFRYSLTHSLTHFIFTSLAFTSLHPFKFHSLSIHTGSTLFIEDQNVSKCLHTKHAILARWQLYTQRRVATRELLRLKTRLRDLRTKRSVLVAVRTTLRSRYTFPARSSTTCLSEKRVLADIDRWRKTFVTPKSKSQDLKFKQRRQNHIITAHADTLEYPTLRKIVSYFRSDVLRRVKHEQRLLCVLFKQRHRATYGNRCVYPEDHHESNSSSMTGDDFLDSGLKDSTRLAEVCVTCQRGNGVVVGITRILETKAKTMIRGMDHGIVSEEVEHFTFALRKNERLVRLEGYCKQSSVIECVRFVTNRSRVSKWYGQDNAEKRKGKFFQLDAAKELDGSAGWIIGFCGREDPKRQGALCELGIVSHQRLPANVLANCWSDCNSERDRKKAENEFAVLLRMRTSDVISVLSRAVQLSKSLFSSKSEVKTSARVAFQLSKWFFESVNRGLVRCPSKRETERAAAVRLRGQTMVRRGEALVLEAERILSGVEGYDPHTGIARLDVALIGMAQVREYRKAIQIANKHKKRGNILIARGQAISHKADEMLPRIDAKRNGLREYYENLCRLSHTANELTPEEVKLMRKLDEENL